MESTTGKQTTQGYLQVTNMLAPMNTKYFTFSKLADIESELLDKMFTNLQQSEGEVPFEKFGVDTCD